MSITETPSHNSVATLLTAKGRPALVSSATYRYRFPMSKRHIGGAFTVEQSVERLLFAYRMHRQLLRAAAGALIRIAPFELKVELAHHLFQHGDAASLLRNRLAELRVSERVLDEIPPESLRNIAHMVLLCEEPIAFVICYHGVLGRRLLAYLDRYVEETDSLLDQPSIRILRTIRADLTEMVAWSSEVEQAALEAGDDMTAISSANSLLAAAFDAAALDASSCPSGHAVPVQPTNYVRPTLCARDERFSTFHHTRRYDASDLKANTAPTDPFEISRLELFRVQRDELDAIETFANIIYDLEGRDFELESGLARLVWDEARHAEMGQQNLRRLGFDPFEIPCGIIGINVRATMPPTIALAQISIFGELNQVGTLRRMAHECYRRGDPEGGRSFDFTHADEVMHLRRGRAWLARLAKADGISLDDLETMARDAAVRRLREEGVLGEDYENTITSAELASMIGE